MCGVKTSFLYRTALRLPWMRTSGVFRSRIWHSTSSHFLRHNCRPQGRISGRTSHSGVCGHVYGHLFSAARILIHPWTRLASSYGGPNPLLCCTIGPLQVDADVSVLRQSKDVWRVSRFHGDGFWLSVPIFVGDLGHLMLFLLLARSGFSGEVPRCSDFGLLMYFKIWTTIFSHVAFIFLESIYICVCVCVRPLVSHFCLFLLFYCCIGKLYLAWSHQY